MPLNEKTLAAKIQEEHDHLKEEMKKISTLLQQETTEESYPQWRLDLMWKLRDFNTELLKHFDLEEEGGFMRDVLKMAPQKINAVRELEDEHVRISENLDTVLKQLKQTENRDESALAAIRNGVKEIMAMILAHEAAEGELIATTYYQDDGVGD